MATAANIHEPYSISDARSGTIRVSRLVLTGWGATPSASAGLKTWSDQGRMWGVFTYASANSGDFSLRRRGPGIYANTDEICSGTVADGKVTLAADNSSGITGTCDVDNGTPGTNPSADATFDVVVGYADENDLSAAMAGASSMLQSSTYPGGASNTRFERLLLDAKQWVDKRLLAQLEPRLEYDSWGRPLLAHIVRVGDLAYPQALAALHLWNQHRANLEPRFLELADRYAARAMAELKATTFQFDYERDVQPDTKDKAGVARVFRA